MKTLIIKLLGLNTLVKEINLLKNEVLVLADENKELKNRVKHLDDEVNALEERVQEKIDEIDIEELVRDLFNDASPAPMSEDAIKEEVSESVRKALAEVFSKAYDQVQKS